HDESIARKGCRTLDFTRRPMSGFILVSEEAMKTNKDFEHWIGLSLDFNAKAKKSKKKKST
ncbi:MAG TPA: RNA methyltransferase, partial [Puia sp.]